MTVPRATLLDPALGLCAAGNRRRRVGAIRAAGDHGARTLGRELGDRSAPGPDESRTPGGPTAGASIRWVGGTCATPTNRAAATHSGDLCRPDDSDGCAHEPRRTAGPHRAVPDVERRAARGRRSAPRDLEGWVEHRRRHGSSPHVQRPPLGHGRAGHPDPE